MKLANLPTFKEAQRGGKKAFADTRRRLSGQGSALKSRPKIAFDHIPFASNCAQKAGDARRCQGSLALEPRLGASGRAPPRVHRRPPGSPRTSHWPPKPRSAVTRANSSLWLWGPGSCEVGDTSIPDELLTEAQDPKSLVKSRKK